MCAVCRSQNAWSRDGTGHLSTNDCVDTVARWPVGFCVGYFKRMSGVRSNGISKFAMSRVSERSE